MYKVLTAVEKHSGGTYWMRVGTGFTNKDNSVNIYLDAMPKTFQFQLRELDEEDLRRRDGSRGESASGSGESVAAAARARAASQRELPVETVPF
jgi:hypothetical protein